MAVLRFSCLLVAIAALTFGPVARAATFDWSRVGAPANICDQQYTGCYGSVGYTYWIARHEVTNAQYAEFLNVVAVSDPTGLYNEAMGSDSVFGGIDRIGTTEPFGYAAKSGFEQLPVVYVSFYDVLRFVNWLHNGQPTGIQDTGTTEDGAYTLTAQAIEANSIVRNPLASFVVPSEDEWYKAAYFESSGETYFDYPTRVSQPFEPACMTPVLDDGNTANCGQAVGGLTEVGAYADSFGPFGTYDQGGNVAEWNETILDDPNNPQGPTRRGLRGGAWSTSYLNLGASFRGHGAPDRELQYNGFRVAALVPEPIPALCVQTAILVLASLARRRSR